MEAAAFRNSHVWSYCLQFSTFLLTQVCPQDLGTGWLWDAGLCLSCSSGVSNYLRIAELLRCFMETWFHWAFKFTGRWASMPEPKWDLEEAFVCFHVSMLIFTGKRHEVLHFRFSFCLCTVLHSTNLVFGLAQNFHVAYPGVAGERGFTCIWIIKMLNCLVDIK